MTGEPFSLDRPDLLFSAVARPSQYFAYGQQKDILTLALVLLFGIAENHPFRQGNKRTGFISSLAFMEANGFVLTIDDTDVLGRLIIQVINRSLTQAQFREILEPFVKEI